MRSSVPLSVFILTLLAVYPATQPALQVGIEPGQALVAAAPPVRAAHRGNPWINYLDGMTLATGTTAVAGGGTEAERKFIRPLALAAIDFNDDGIPDLVSGYGGREAGAGGRLFVQFGDSRSVYPMAPVAQRRPDLGGNVAPFSAAGTELLTPDAPDFLLAGDFDADGHADLILGQRGHGRLIFYAGDGRGNFKPARFLPLPGSLTVLISSDVNRPDLLPDLVAGVVAADGAKLAVFESPAGAFNAAPEIVNLPAPATAIIVQPFRDNFMRDVIAAAGHELVLVEGRDRKLSQEIPGRTAELPPKVWTRKFPYPILDLAPGRFSAGRANGVSAPQELALLSTDGDLHVVAFSADAKPIWRETFSTRLPDSPERLMNGRVSALGTDDLLFFSPTQGSVGIFNAAREPVESAATYPESPFLASLDATGAVAAIAPMRLNPDGLDDLVLLLDPGTESPETAILLSAPMAVFTVTNTNDGGAGSFRKAILDANATNNNYSSIVFNIGAGGPQTIAPITVLPTIAYNTVIDATTQPGYTGIPFIELRGAPGMTTGIYLSGLGGTVRGFVINQFNIGIRANDNLTIEREFNFQVHHLLIGRIPLSGS